MEKLNEARRAGRYVCDARGSFHCGDAVACILEGLSVETVEAIARGLGYTSERYAHLNRGQRRLNIGNKLRHALRRGELTLDALLESCGAYRHG